MDDYIFEDCCWDGAIFGSFTTMVGSMFVGSRPTRKQLGDAILESDDSPELVAEVKAEVEREFAARAAEQRRRQGRRPRPEL